MKTFYLLLALFLIGSAGAETIRLTPVAEKITVDGKLSEKVWQRKADVEKFYLFGPRPENFQAVKTQVFLTYDKNCVYVAARCEEPEMKKLVLTAKKNDEPAWKDDALEIFLTPSTKSTEYVQIVVNADGVVFDLYNRGIPSQPSDVTWNSGAICKTFKGKNFWSLEAAIPLTNIPVHAPEGDWKFHIARNRVGHGENYTFVDGINSFHDVSRFFILSGIRIPDLKVTVQDIDPGEEKYGTNTARIRVKNWSKERAAVTVTALGAEQTAWIAPQSTSVLSLNWEQLLEQKECRQEFAVKSSGKLLRRLSLKKAMPELFTNERNVVSFIERNQAVKLEVPFYLAATSKAQLRWRVTDTRGELLTSGVTAVRNGKAILRIFWSFMTPGNYKLSLTLLLQGKPVAGVTRDLRLVYSPFEGI